MKTDILGVKIDNLSFDEVIHIIVRFLSDEKKHCVVTPNPEIVVYAQKDRKFKKILNEADLAIADGIGLVWASSVLGTSLKERVAGVDVAEKLCELAAKNAFTVGFLGGGPQVAKKAAECQKRKYPGLKVAFALSSDPENAAKDINKAVSSQFTVDSSPKKNAVNSELRTVDLLFVAYGYPKQEYWMGRYLQKSNVKVAIGVGGTLDYFAGLSKRAPVSLRNLGLEWLWRLFQEPWRIKRQLSLLIFVWLLLVRRLRAD